MQSLIGFLSLLMIGYSHSQGQEKCPRPDEIAPCQCRTRGPSIQVRCTNSMIERITEAITNIRKNVDSIDVLILEDNTILDLPSRAFGSINVNRLFIQNNRLHSIDRNAFAGIEDFITELYIKEPNLKNFPLESVDYLNKLEVFSIENSKIIDIPRIAGLSNLKLFKLDGSNVRNLNSQSLKNLPMLKYLHVSRSNIRRIEVGLLESLHSLVLANFSDNAISWIHPRSFSYSHYLTEINLKGNAINDAAMVGRATGYVQSLEHLDISHNLLTEVKQGSFYQIPQLRYIDLSYNSINQLEKRSFVNLKSLKIINLSRNRIERFMSDAFEDSSNIEKLFLNRNKILSLSDISFLMDTLPNLRYLELSENEIQEIPFGVFRVYPKLERLFLSGNQISHVSAEGLADMPSLNELDLSHNKLIVDQIASPIFNLQNLKILKISYNKLKQINENVLKNLPMLRRLDISNNGITLIERDAFKGVSNLDYLNASYNSIKELDPSIFSGLRELYELDLSFNELSILPSNLLLSQNKLEYISFSNNQLQYLPSSLLSHENRVKHLDLTSNFVRKFPDDLINKLKNLKKLLFVRNSLDKLTSKSFLKLTSLESIQLHDNRIEIIDNDTFQHLHSLKHLDLSLNIISTVGISLNPLSNLIKLNLSDNYITVLPQKTFTSLKRLSTLDVSNNTIMEISEAFKDMPALKYLDLSYNHLPIIKEGTFSDLPSLLSLKLDHNSIVEVVPGAFDRLWKLDKLSFTKNGLKTIKTKTFTDLPSLESLYLNDNLIQSLEDNSFEDLYSLKKLHLDQNLITNINERAFKRIPSIRYLNMSLNLIQDLPRSGFLGLETLETIDLSFNDIRRIDDGTFENMKWLTELSLNDNNVCEVGKNVFNDVTSLSSLDLQNNRLSRINIDSFSPLKNKISSFRIAGNPITCDCETLWLKNWLTEDKVVKDHPRCYFPKSVSGSRLKTLRTSRFKCERLNNEDSNLIIRDACLGVPLKTPVRQTALENEDVTVSTETPITSTHKANINKGSENQDFQDENEEIDYEYYYVYYDEDGNVIKNRSEKFQPESKPVVSKVQEINLGLGSSSDSKPGDTPTIYAGNNKQGSISSSLLTTTTSTTSTTTEGFSIFGFPLPSLPKLPPVSLSFDLKPSQLGNSFLLPVGRKGDASKQVKKKKIDHTRGPDDLEFPIWVDSLSRYKKEISKPKKDANEGLNYIKPPNPIIPLKSFYDSTPALKFEPQFTSPHKLVHKSMYEAVSPFHRQKKPMHNYKEEPMSFAASEGINGFRPLFKPNSVDPLYTIGSTMSTTTTTNHYPAYNIHHPSLVTPIYVHVQKPKSSSNIYTTMNVLKPSPVPTINHKIMLKKPLKVMANGFEDNFKVRNQEVKVDSEEKASKPSKPEIKVPTSTTTTTIFTSPTTVKISSTLATDVSSTTKANNETVEYEYEYYYEYYDEDEGESSTNLSTTTLSTTTSTTTTTVSLSTTTTTTTTTTTITTTTTTTTTTTKVIALPITSTIISYIDGSHNFDNKKSLASVETRNGVLSRSRGMPTSSTLSTSSTTPYPFHPDTFDPTARTALDLDDPETEAINWYFNGEDRNPYVDPKIVRQQTSLSDGLIQRSSVSMVLVLACLALSRVYNFV